MSVTPRPSLRTPTPYDGIRLLVVDHDESARAAVRHCATGRGWVVEEADSIANALRTTAEFGRASVRDCILLDLFLPDGDGFAALMAFQRANVVAPVVILSGVEDAETVVGLLNAGASDFIPKRALSPQRLDQVIRRVTHPRQSQRERWAEDDRTRAEQRLLAAVIEQLPSGLLMSDASGRILRWNSRLLSLLGNDLSQATTLSELVALTAVQVPGAPQGRAELVRSMQDVSEGGQDFELKGEGGAVVVRLRHAIVPAEDGSVARLAVLDDVTDLRTTEAYQRQVMAIASHDLKNPLASITMNGALLCSDGHMDDGRRTKSAGRILSSANRMGRLIDDLLDYTTATFSRGILIRREDTDLAIVAEEAVTEARASHVGREVVLAMSGDLRGAWDRDRLHQVMQNLVDNALRHGDPGGMVNVHCQEDVDQVGVTIRVANQGPPIASDLLPQIFEAHKPRTNVGRRGLGFGLYIVRRILDAHQGNIAITSSLGRGTEVVVRLPKQRIPDQGRDNLLTPPSGTFVIGN